MYARLKTPHQKVWQYNDKAAVIDIPMWISGCTQMHGDGLMLVRPSGKQRIDHGDWLVQDDGGRILWLTDQEFQREYELLYSDPPKVAS